jgi:hypothetical protein
VFGAVSDSQRSAVSDSDMSYPLVDWLPSRH